MRSLQIKKRRLNNWRFLKAMERVAGIEPVWPAWEARVLPLNYTRSKKIIYKSVHKNKKTEC